MAEPSFIGSERVPATECFATLWIIIEWLKYVFQEQQEAYLENSQESHCYNVKCFCISHIWSVTLVYSYLSCGNFLNRHINNGIFMVYFNIMMVVYYKTCFSWTNKKGSGQGLTIYIWQPNSGKPDTFLFCKEEGSSGQDEEPVSLPVVAEATWNTSSFHKVTWISGCDSLLQSNCGANTQLMRQEIRAYRHNRKVCEPASPFLIR